MGVIKITESMRKDPKIHLLSEKTIGTYKITITKAKAWFHKFADWEIIVVDTRSQKTLLHSSHSEVDTSAQKAAENLAYITTIKDVKKLIENPRFLYK